MTFEKTVPEWLAAGAEPPASLKSSGFAAGYKPPAAYFNWFWYSVSQCLKELQEKCGENTGTPVVPITSNDGVTYSATVDGVTELTTGLSIVAIPDTTSTSTATKLNLNGLGAKAIRMPLTNNTAATTTAALDTWMSANYPVALRYNGTAWETDIFRPSASSIYGSVAVENGGTGADNAEDALTSLGAAPASHTHSADDINSGTINSNRLPTVPVSKGGTGSTNGATGLKNLLAAGNTILSSYQYGTSLPTAGSKGRIFFKKVSS